MSNLKYLGQALKYPIELVNGSAQIANSEDSIQQSIRRILSTEKDSRFFLPEYGSRLHEMLFEPNIDVLFPMLRLFISESISKWEKRVKLVDINFNKTDDKVECEIYYEVVSTSEAFYYIYPFYLKINN